MVLAIFTAVSAFRKAVSFERKVWGRKASRPIYSTGPEITVHSCWEFARGELRRVMESLKRWELRQGERL